MLRFIDVAVHIRLLPLQVMGKQATNTAYKARSALRMLSLEADDVQTARLAVRSLLSDMGVESGLWSLPDLDAPGSLEERGRCFPFSIPLADFDHLLHHVMEEVEGGFSTAAKELWDSFDAQLSALSKVFSKRQSRGDDLSQAEGEGLRKLAADQLERSIFWAMFWAVYCLEQWGFKVHMWLKACPCPQHQGESERRRKRKDRQSDPHPKEGCKHKGRRLIELADGQAQHFQNELKSLRLEGFQPAAAALARLRSIDEASLAVADDISKAFVVAQRKVLLRFEQGSAYYTKFPWCVVKLLRYILVPPGQERVAAERNSRQLAADWCRQRDAGQLQVRGTFAEHLFEGDFLVSMRNWGGGGEGTVMDNNLFAELVGYGVSLVSMQRLEARHHLVNIKMGSSRASGATTASAALRRRQNPDCRQKSFRAEFEDYLQRFDELVPEDWSSMAELHRLVSGHHIAVMFRDVATEDAMIQQLSSSNRVQTPAHLLELFNHIKVVLREGAFYAVPVSTGASGATTYDVMQLLSFKPSAKKYMERVVGWGSGADKWQDHVAVALLGQRVVEPGRVTIDLEHSEQQQQQICPFQPGETFVSPTSTVEAFPVQSLFKLDFEHVCQFQTVKHACRFSEDALMDALDIDLDELAGEAGNPVNISGFRRAPSLASESAASEGSQRETSWVSRQGLEIVPDMVFLQQAKELGQRAATSGKPIVCSSREKPAADWLVSRNLASFTPSGGLVLLSNAMETTTFLSNPVRVDSVCSTTWSLRRRLDRQGWRTGAAADACVEDKVFNGKNSIREYLALLLDRPDDILRYQDKGAFSHAVLSGGYYDCVRAAFENHASTVVDVPKNMTSAGYGALCSFLLEETDADPRKQKDNLDWFRSATAKVKSSRNPSTRKPKAQVKVRRRNPRAVRESALADEPAVEVSSDSDADMPVAPALDIEPSAASEVEAASASAMPSAASEVEAASASAGAPAAAPPSSLSVRRHLDRPAPEPLPMPIEPRVKNDGHRAVTATLLPYLRQVMLEDAYCTLNSRAQIHEALTRADFAGLRCWGVNQLYSRKRTVEDLILQHYVDAVRITL
ncbi:PREP1 [Symbiodinium sp. CCMP2592]|nr:PREP1 [Symbiodinium sp. CCMP2592]